MDEPTSVLTPQAVRQAVRDAAHSSRPRAAAILYISHKLDEIRALCDRAHDPARRPGDRRVRPAPGDARVSLAALMIGAELPRARRTATAAAPAPVRSPSSALTLAAAEPFGIDLRRHLASSVRAGEIVGIAGVSGNGQQRAAGRAVGRAHARAPDAIRARRHAGRQRSAAPRRRALGLRFVPEERLGRGAVPDAVAGRERAAHRARASASRRGGLIRAGARRARFAARRSSQRFDVEGRRPGRGRAACPAATCRSSSSAARSMQDPKRADRRRSRPGASTSARPPQIRQALLDLARRRGAPCWSSREELDELFEICDRLAVIARGRLSPAVAGRAGHGRADRAADGRALRRGRDAPQEHARMLLRLEPRPEPSRLMLWPRRRAGAWCSRVRRRRRRCSRCSARTRRAACASSSSSRSRRAYGAGRAAAEGDAADPDRARPGGRLPRQRLEHRRRGPVRPRRDLRRRRGAAAFYGNDRHAGRRCR